MSEQPINFRPVIPGKVYRSAAPYSWDAATVDAFASAQGVQTVVDLRIPLEVDAAGWAGLPNDRVGLSNVAIDLAVNAGQYLSPDTPEGLGEQYLNALRVWGPQWVDALRPIADGQVTLYHCAAGKDRTGIVCAMVRKLAGQDDEQVIADYAVTAGAMPAIFGALEAIYGPPADEAALARQSHPVVNAPAGAMRTFIVGLAQEYGSVEGYLAQAGASDELVSSIKQRLRD